jgi:hypothetical protein
MSNGVNTKLAIVIERLDSIIPLLTGHADVVDLLTNINTDTTSLVQVLPQIRDEQADIHLDTQSMDLKLLAIRDEQADIHLDTQSMDLKLLDMRNTLTYIYTQVLNLAPGTFDWAAVLGTPADSSDNILDWLAGLISSMGIPTGDATTTILGRLSAIETLNFNYLPLIATNTGKCPCGASPPPEGNICAEPYISTGMSLVPTAFIPNFNSVTIAIWGTTPPAQLEYGTVFGTVSDNSSLVPASGQNWTGRSIFVESSADNFALQTLSTARYPTNTWVDLTDQGTAEISVMVDAGAAVRAYICPDNGGGGGGTWGGGGGGGTWGDPDLGEITTCHTFASHTYDYPGFGIFHVVTSSPTYAPNVLFTAGAFGGYSIRLVTYGGGTSIRCDYYDASGTYNSGALLGAINEVFFYPAGTTAIGCHTDQVAGGNPFSIELCPPA